MTENFKRGVQKILVEHHKKGWSYQRIASEYGSSTANVSHIVRGIKFETISDAMWQKIAKNIGYETNEWQIAATTNLASMIETISTAKSNRMFMAVSYLAGAGKTEGINQYLLLHRSKHNYSLICRRWGKREFLENLMAGIGMEKPKGYITIDGLSKKVINFFVMHREETPLLILDQANSLKPSALDFLIHLYNEMEGFMGVVVVGTEALEKEIKRGVRYDKQGYDELDSRFGRKYIGLRGASRQDVSAIAIANGITDVSIHQEIWKESNYITKSLGKGIKPITVVEDLRRVKRVVQKKLLQLKK